MKQMSRVVLVGGWLSLVLGTSVCAQEGEVLSGGEDVREPSGTGAVEGDGIFIELADPFEVGFNGGVVAGTEPPAEPDACGFEFQRGFAFPGGFTNGNGSQSAIVHALEVFDDGSGAQLAIGGEFLVFGGTPGASVQIWDGVEYTALAPGGRPDVFFTSSFATFDDGSGLALYATGGIAVAFDPSRGFVAFARWDGHDWSTDFTFGGPFDQAERDRGPHVVREGNLGDGPQLYCARDDSFGITVARYDGTDWDVIAEENTIQSATEFTDLIIFDDGMGPTLYLAGRGLMIGLGEQIVQLLQYRDGEWSSAGLEISGKIVSTLAVFDDGEGDALYAGGDGGLFRLSDDQWTSVLDLSASEDEAVSDLFVWDDGAGPALFVAGRFPDPDALGRFGVLGRWTPDVWTVLGSHVESPTVDLPHGASLTSFDDGSGEALYIGGAFNYLGSDTFDEAFDPVSDPDVLFGGVRQLGGVNARSIARWDGRWEIVGGGLISSGINRINFAEPRSMIVHDDGTGDALYIGGDIALRGGVSDGVVRRADRGWERVGEPLDGIVSALASDQSPGGLLYAAGSFQAEPFTSEFIEQVLAWDGHNWKSLGEDGFNKPIRGLAAPGQTPYVEASDSLVAVGDFDFAGSQTLAHVAAWDGVGWHDVGEGTNGPVNAAIFDDTGAVSLAGSLVVAGDFDMAGDTEALGVAIWDGSQWHSFGSGLSGTVTALAIFDGGAGPELYVGGRLVRTEPRRTSVVLRWDGESWQDLRPPTEISELGAVVLSQTVRVLKVIGRGNKSMLVAGGTSPRVRSGASIVFWDGVAWGEFGNARPHHSIFFTCSSCVISALADFNEGDGPALWVGGQFISADERAPADIPQRGRSPSGASSITKWIQKGLPSITTQPASSSFNPGSTATFTVEATDPDDDEQLWYRWLRDGVPISDDRPIVKGVHSPELTIFPVRPIDEGEYSCVVSNSCGENTSRPATLSVLLPAVCTGDANRSGEVNFDDLTTILVRWGVGSGGQGERVWAVRGDATGDGVVDFEDIVSVLANWGRACEGR